MNLLLYGMFFLIFQNQVFSQTVTDIDGNVYNTVAIGNQLWLKENLKTTKYADGSSLVNGKSAGDIYGDYTTKYYFSLNNNDNNIITYGRLYTWAAAMNGSSSSATNPSGVQGVCPMGWHLPSDAEWLNLINFLGGENVAGGKLKEIGTTLWNSPNIGATNESSFTALPGTFRSSSGINKPTGYSGNWCSSTDSNVSSAWTLHLRNDTGISIRRIITKSDGVSVRCISNISVTGMKESVVKPQFKLYPNPCDSKFDILIVNKTTDKVVIEIYNLMGEKVLQQEISNEIDLSKSPKGIYFVKIYDGEKIYNEKIVTQ